jgi:hypothetical protein
MGGFEYDADLLFCRALLLLDVDARVEPEDGAIASFVFSLTHFFFLKKLTKI